LLIVIAVLGIFIVAILSALDPLEQVRKARDSGRQADAAEMQKGVERYFTTYGCNPWDTTAPAVTCQQLTNQVIVGTAIDTPVNDHTDADYAGGVAQMVAQSELKAGFANRPNFVNDFLFISEDDNREVSVCFEPESLAARNGSLGPTFDDAAGTTTPANGCAGAFAGGADPGAGCFICVPQ
jgi:hypothetical protein